MKNIVMAFVAVFATILIGFTSVVYAADPPAAPAATGAAGEVKKGIDAVDGGGNTTDLPGFIKAVINVLLFIIGAVSVIMIIVGGIRYATSNGDQANVKAAKDTILYAVIGLVVALLAFAIVNFVVTNIK